MDTGQKEWPISVSAVFVDVMIAYTCPILASVISRSLSPRLCAALGSVPVFDCVGATTTLRRSGFARI